MSKNPCKVITGKHTVMAYLNVNDPKTPLSGGKPKYSVQLIWPKEDEATSERIRDAIQAAYLKGKSKLAAADGTVPEMKTLKLPVRDGDREHPGDPVYQHCWFLNANSTSRPGIVDANRQLILDRSELYSGIVGRASIEFYAFNSSGNRGIAVGLLNLQKLADGTPLGTHARPEDDFADIEDEDEPW